MYNCRAEGMAMWKCKIAVQRKLFGISSARQFYILHGFTPHK